MIAISRLLPVVLLALALTNCGTSDTGQTLPESTIVPSATSAVSTATPFAKGIPNTLTASGSQVQPSPTVIQLAPPQITPPAGANLPASRQPGQQIVVPTANPVIPTLPVVFVEPLAIPEEAEMPDAIRERLFADLTQRAGVDRSVITIVSVEAVIWNDGALGCPEAGVEYTQALVEGYRVVLAVATTHYDYRVPRDGMFKICV